MNWTLKYSPPSWQRQDFIRLIKHARGVKLIVSFDRESKWCIESTSGYRELSVKVNYRLRKLFDVVLWGHTSSHVCQLKAFVICVDVDSKMSSVCYCMDFSSKHLDINVYTSLSLPTWNTQHTSLFSWLWPLWLRVTTITFHLYRIRKHKLHKSFFINFLLPKSFYMCFWAENKHRKLTADLLL